MKKVCIAKYVYILIMILVFATATALLVYSGLDADTWGMIAMMYIGGQSAIDFAKIWKGA